MRAVLSDQYLPAFGSPWRSWERAESRFVAERETVDAILLGSAAALGTELHPDRGRVSTGSELPALDPDVIFESSGIGGEVTGVLFEDTDANGLQDEGEAVLSGWTVFVDANQDGLLSDGELSTTTDENGQYTFINLASGDFQIGIEVEAGYHLTPEGGIASFSSQSNFLPELTTTGHDIITYALGMGEEDVAYSAPEDELTFGPDADIQATDLVGLDAFQIDISYAGIDGSGYTIVVLDTGIDTDHSFFGPDRDGDGIADRIVYTADYSGSPNGAHDVDGHGTHVTSVAASSDGTFLGPAHGANIIHLKVLGDNGSGSGAWLEQALQWVAANAATYNIVALNMSLGFGNNDTTENNWFLTDELQALDALGVINVSSAGNSFFGFQEQGAGYPASDPYSIGVGAVYDADGGQVSFSSGAISYSRGPDEITSFSQRSETLTEIFAPGGAITGARTGGGTATYYGTSQASPLIAGIAVIAQQLADIELGRRLSMDEFRDLMQTTGIIIYDGDDEDDNVTNTDTNYYRVDVEALAAEIVRLGTPTISQTVTVVDGMSVEADFAVLLNEDPIAADDLFTTGEESLLLTGDVIADNGNGADSDVEGDILTISAVEGIVADIGQEITLGSGALLELNIGGSFTYLPNGQFDHVGVNQTTTDSFTYTLNDQNGGTATGTVTVTINGENDPVMAADDDYTTDEDTRLTTINAVLNDVDIDGDVLTVIEVDRTGTKGLVANLGDGRFYYNPNSQFENLANGEVATDSFSYTVSDGNGSTSTATITIMINGLDDVAGEMYAGTVDGDIHSSGKFADSLEGFGGNDTLSGNLHDDTILGGEGDDLISGQGHDDLLLGEAGNDTVIGGGGADNLSGGTEDDLLSGNGDADTLDGGAGNDNLFAGDGDDMVNGGLGLDNLYGGDGVDTLDGGDDNDLVNGEGGNDLLFGSLGADSLNGGIGDDTANGGEGTDLIGGNDGMDSLLGGAGDDRIFAGGNADIADGEAGNDSLYGGDDDDILNGGDDNDELVGEAGNDEISGDAGADRGLGGAGNDQIFGGTGNDVLLGQNDNDTLHGGDDNDFINAGSGNDELNGDDGADQLYAGSGLDTLTGGSGNDTMRGDADNDLFVFTGTTGIDIITDFIAGAGSEDVISLIAYGTALDEFSEVQAAASDNGTDTTIDLGGGNILILWDVTVAELHEDDFIFS